MGQTRGQIKTTVRTNLNDNGITFWSEDDLNDSFQDAYDDIVCISQCIVKSTIVNWIPDLVYYNPITDLSISDYLAPVAIFNLSTNLWLRDDLNLRDLDRLRRDWECWVGTPQFWCSSDPLHFAIAPHLNVGTPSFKLLYWATAPLLTSDSNTLLTASDVQNLFEFYVTADMLEQAQEYVKASEYWTKYYNSLQEYSARVKTNNKSDLLLRV